MNLKENIRIAIFSIRTNLMRSLLTMLGIIIGVSSVIAIITVGDGGRDYIISMIKDMGSNTVSITVNTTASTSEYISREDIKAIKQLESVSYVSPVVYSVASCSTEKGDGIALGLSGTADFQQIMSVNMLYGRFYTEEEYMSGSHVCIVPPLSAISLFGYENCIGQSLDYTLNGKTISLKVIGVCETVQMGGDSADYSSLLGSFSGEDMGTAAAVIMPSTVSDALMGSSGYYEMIYMIATDDNLLDSVGNMSQNLL